MRKLFTILSFLVSLVASGQFYSASPIQIDTTGGAIDTPTRKNIGLGIDFQNLNQTIPYPNPAGSGQHGSITYFRITADDISKGWSNWDSYFTQALNRNAKVAPRIMTIDDSYGGNTTGGAILAYPTSWHTTFQSESVKDFIIGGVWWPPYNNTSYLTNWRALIVSVVNHMRTTFVGVSGRTQLQLLEYWDIGGIGHYGEFHTYTNAGDTWTFPAGTFWTNATLQEVVNAQRDNLPNVPLVYNINVGASNARMPAGFPSWIMTQSNAWGQFGLRYDNAGNKVIVDFEYFNNTGSENGINFKDESSNRWKVSLVVAEPIQFGYQAAGQVDYYYIKTEIPALHVSNMENFRNIENNGAVPANTAALFISMSKLMGWRWTISSFTMSDSIRPGMNFMVAPLYKNTGIAPLWDSVDVTYELWKGSTLVKTWPSAFKPKGVLPGQVQANDNVTMTGTFAAGTDYAVYVRWHYHDGYWPDAPLQMRGRLADGKYLLRSGIAVASNAAPPPPPPPPPPNNAPSILPLANQTDTLPKNVDTLYGQISDIDGDAVSYTWTQNSGPNTATQGTATGSVTSTTGQTVMNRISGLIAGTYQFTLSASDGKGGSASRTVNVFVVDSIPVIVPPPPPPKVYNPPTVTTLFGNGRYDTTITATSDSAYLRMHVITKDTALQSVHWVAWSGPTVTFSAQNDSTTKVTGLAPFGTAAQVYQFYITVTDKAGNTISTSETPNIIVVQPAIAPQPMPLPGPADKSKSVPIIKKAF